MWRHRHFRPAAAGLVAALLCSCVSAGAGAPTGVLAAGTEWENPYYVIRGAAPGPTVLLTAGLHGDEPAGFRAAEQIRHWPIACGTLIVVPRANTPGLREGTRYLPAWRDDETLRNANRNFPVLGESTGAKTPPCQALWALVEQWHPRWVIDLHEGAGVRGAGSASVGSSVICADTEELNPIAEAVLTAVNATVSGPERRFVRLKGAVKGGLARAAQDVLGVSAVCLETTSKGQPMSTRTRQHRIMVNAALRSIGLLDRDCVDVIASARPRDTRYVGVFDGGGAAERGVSTLVALLDSTEGYAACHLGPVDLRRGALTAFDAVGFPGGSGSAEARALGDVAAAYVREFVEAGGGYLGICAGAYLASSHYSWSLGLLNAHVLTGPVPGERGKQLWYRGESAAVTVEFAQGAEPILGREALTRVEMRYHNGPILSPGARNDLPPYVPLAHFRTEVSRYDAQRGTMVNTPAIVIGQYGEGRVMAISPHPEASPEQRDIVVKALDWLTAVDR
ncbi:MAG: hypothetical protein FJX75_05115 [Armatimonadetes bacterium]|nr:hypothetical protein [Armatimonadota bacterium]